MDAQIRRDEITKNTNIAGMIYGMFGRFIQNVIPVQKRKYSPKTERKNIIQPLENPVAIYDLGWRRDA